jgi:hypothetical protein
MPIEDLDDMFPQSFLSRLLPPEKADAFFEALYGDASEGAYDIALSFQGSANDALEFCLDLRRRPGKCLACNLTYGLPQVFSRHPIIDIAGLVGGIEKRLEGKARCHRWELGTTREISGDLHSVPLTVFLQPTDSPLPEKHLP